MSDFIEIMYTEAQVNELVFVLEGVLKVVDGTAPKCLNVEKFLEQADELVKSYYQGDTG